MKKFKPHFWYTKSQRNGVLFLLLLIVLFQATYFYIDFSEKKEIEKTVEIVAFEIEIDSLKNIEREKRKPKKYFFNPNFISDYKGYQLGMSIEEIDKLHEYRKKEKFVNSIKEFQKVTGVSDSLLNKISPSFKFPDWVLKKQKTKSEKRITSKLKERSYYSTDDINIATFEDFRNITEGNNKLSSTIIKYRSKLKGFSYNYQLKEVWGINESIIEKILKVFSIKQQPIILKTNVNVAGFKEVLKNPYIDYKLCKKIFNYRDEVAEFQDISELRNIKDFPQNKYDRIVLYLKAE